MNAWLQNAGSALRSAMIAPVFLWFLLLVPVVILLYLLKLRRTPVVISSTMLWLRSLQDLTANAPFQKLRRNLLLFLQILIIILVVLALSRPFIESEGMSGSSICLLIDTSASMQAREGEATRIDRAKEAALAAVDDMRGGDRMMLVTFAHSARVLSELTDDRLALRRHIRAIEATDTPTRLRDAMLVAQSIRLGVPDLEVVLMSDGNIEDLGRLSGDTPPVSYLQIGSPQANLGIAAFSVRQPEQGDGPRQCFVLVHNEGETEAATTLTLAFNGSSLAFEEITVPALSNEEVVFSLPELGEGILEARIAAEDALAVDNTAWLALREAAALDVLLVAESGDPAAFLLQTALSRDPRVDLSATTPADYAVGGRYDLTFFMGYAPDTLPEGTLVYFDAIPPVEGLDEEGAIERPPVIATDSEHPVMRFLRPENVGIEEARRLVLPPGARRLLSTTGGALIADVSRGGRQILVVAFDPAESNWPLDLSFPLFVQNVLGWTPRSAMAAETSVAAGRPIALLPGEEVEEATVVTPDGEEHAVALDPLRPTYFARTSNVGVYTVRYGAKDERHAVNLLNLDESTITPEDAVVTASGQFEAQRGELSQPRELWRWFLLGGIAVLALEWWIFSRRAWL